MSVCVSAVNPAPIMRPSKRAAEIGCRYFNGQSRTCRLMVRLGNALGSTGSRIPPVQEQIESGGPVTEVTRYFMTMTEAARPILQASAIGEDGEIFVSNMGEPVNISYLAKQLVLLSGKRPSDDVEIVYTGLRPGEKLYEELFHRDEARAETTHPQILLAGSGQVKKDIIERAVRNLQRANAQDDEARMKKILLFAFVPEHASLAVDAIPAHAGMVESASQK